MPQRLLDVLYDGLNTGWLAPEDLHADLAAVQVWVRFAEPCSLHPGGGCHSLSVHEFAADGGASLYPHCDENGPRPVRQVFTGLTIVVPVGLFGSLGSAFTVA